MVSLTSQNQKKDKQKGKVFIFIFGVMMEKGVGGGWIVILN